MKNQTTILPILLSASLLLASCGQPTKPATKAPEEKPAAKADKYAEALAKLSPEDRKLAEAQKFCALAITSRLGGMGPPVKILVEGEPVFLCCDGCKEDALANPKETLANVAKLKADNK